MKLGNLKLGAVKPIVKAEQPQAEIAPVVESEPQPPVAAPAVKSGIKLGGLRIGAAAAAPAIIPATTTQAPAESTDEGPQIVKGTPEGFQALLDRLDALIIAGEGVSVLTLDTARHYVADIYTELATFPEFDPIFKDRDMHNVMAFVQRSTIQAKAVIATKQVKASTRAAKAISTQFGDFGSFGDMSAKPITSQIAAANAAGNALLMLQTVDLSQIEGKDRGQKK